MKAPLSENYNYGAYYQSELEGMARGEADRRRDSILQTVVLALLIAAMAFGLTWAKLKNPRAAYNATSEENAVYVAGMRL